MSEPTPASSAKASHASSNARKRASAPGQQATAPNFTVARERLKPGWTKRWILDPALMSPGTAMPSGLFRMENGHNVFTGPTPPSFNGYNKDHADLLVRYMFQFTPEEMARLRGSAGAK